jgi:serine/threonine protein kinase
MADGPQDDRTKSFIALSAGTLVSHYKIINKIGSGGMGEVYLAQDTQLDRKVALKFLPPHLCADEDCRKRFKREAQAAAKLDHPNIISVYEVSEYNGRPYFAMAHVEGKSLKEFATGKDLTIEQILELAIQICGGLHAAHEKGVTHRDVKPSNILIDSHGRARIVDFGLASVRDADQLTKTGSTMGTIGYMSPEQVQGKEVDHRSDLFSLGVVLYELITKQNPFKRASEAATLKAVSDEFPEPLARYKSAVPDEAERIVSKLLAKNKLTRYQHADDVCADLRMLLTDLGSTRFRRALPAQERKASIAVLPFINMSPDRANEYFSDGITEDIIAQIAKIRSLRVISRTSIMRYKHTEKSIREIGQELNVTTILEGSVRKTDDRVRIVCQLIDAETDEHIWAETYDRQLKDVFEIQSDVAQRIVNALKTTISPSDRERLKKIPTSNMDAYNLYLLGRLHWNKRTANSLERAIHAFNRSIELDSHYALAYAGVAECYVLLPWYGHWLPRDAVPAARKAALTALDLDPNLGEAFTSLGAIKNWYDKDWPAAHEDFLRAIELSPNYVTGHHWLGFFLTNRGHFREGITELRVALGLDPLSHIINANYADALYFDRQFDAAIKQYQRGIEIDPSFLYLHEGLGKAYLLKGMYEQAIEVLEKAGRGEITMALCALGRDEDARSMVRELEQTASGEWASIVNRAMAHLGIGDNKRAIELLEEADEMGCPWVMERIKVDPYLDGLRSDSRFQELLVKYGT